MTRSEPFHSSQPVQRDIPDDAFTIYLAKQFIVKQGFEPARVPELVGLASACDVVLTFADGHSFIIVCMVDREAQPDKSLAMTIDQLDDVGQTCLKYTGKVRGNKILPTFLVLEIGSGWSEDQRRRIELLKYTSRHSKISAMAIDVAAGEVRSNSTSRFSKAPYRGFIEDVLRSPRETDADLARQQVAPASFSFPVVTSALIALMCALFAAEMTFGIGPPIDLLRPTIATLIAFGGQSGNLVIQSGEWYRLLSAPFLHADAVHLAFNMVALYLAGRSLEGLIGRAWFGTTYLLGAVGGAWLSLLVNPAAIVSVGASGAIMGLFAATLVTSFRFPPGALRAKLRTNALYILLPSLLPLASLMQSSKSLNNKVDYAAHFGGALAGTVVGLLMLTVWPNSQSQPRFQRIAAAVAIAGLAALVVPAVPLARDYQSTAFIAQLIPQQSLPKTSTEFTERADELIAKYPRDPRPRFYKATKLLDTNELVGVEREARAALAEENLWKPLLLPQFSTALHMVLALAISGDRRDEALAEARQPCFAFKDGPMRKMLDERKLCMQ